ncbi:hypothetical protein GCM10022291_26770 [Postechiella marina]|uniref:Helix-turn-helix domain-containing protein n=1 Tax=Postechiella marina TaxID=943941 RepID=A0ABP8CE96_9FLAO
MSPHLDTSIIKTYLLKICNDRMFEKSPRNVRLLKFLVEQAIKKSDVSEYIVGTELFQDSYTPENKDSKVRVYMYNLRKKLKEYYATSGKDDNLIFIVEKGQYNLKFQERNTQKNTKLKATINKKILWGASIFTLLLTVLFISKKIFKEDLYCWNDFFKSSSNICVMADQTMIYKTVGLERFATMNFYINNKSDFINYVEKHPNDSIKLANYTLLSKMAPFSVKNLTEWFLKHNSNFSLRLESSFEMDETRTNNLLYIGQFKTMGTSKSIFLKDSHIFKHNTNVSNFVVVKNGKEKTYSYKIKEGISYEYAMVSYNALENGKKALFFVSNNDIGVMATVNNFMNKKWLANFYKNLPANKKYFNALFEVKGINRTEIDCKLVDFEALN